MSKIKAKNTSPEIFVRSFLHVNGFRFRLHEKRLPGKPDLVLPKYNLAIFVNGCFWHGHSNCRDARLPKSNIEFWKNKIELNQKRDKRKTQELQDMGWRVAIIWECELVEENLQRLIEHIKLPRKRNF